MKSWLQDNHTEMHSTHEKLNSVVVEIRTLKDKTYKCMNSVSKNVFINDSAGMANKCNNTYHSIMKINSVDVKPSDHLVIM